MSQITVKSASGFAGEEVAREPRRVRAAERRADASVKKPKKQEGRTAVAKAARTRRGTRRCRWR